jgi:hypothetical protein
MKTKISISKVFYNNKYLTIIEFGKNNIKYKFNLKENFGIPEGFYYIRKHHKVGFENDFYVEIVNLFEDAKIYFVRVSDIIKEIFNEYDLELIIEDN